MKIYYVQNILKVYLENNPLKNLEDEFEKLKITSGAKFFDKSKQKDFPERDFYLCTEINKFNFVLRVKQDVEDNLYIEKVEI